MIDNLGAREPGPDRAPVRGAKAAPLRVLFVAYRFPPAVGGGVLRPVKFAKYLSRAGVDVTVLSIDVPPGVKRDEALLADLPAAVRVLRVADARPPEISGAGPRGRHRHSALNWARVGYRWTLHHTLVPDMHAGFIKNAVKAAQAMEGTAVGRGGPAVGPGSSTGVSDRPQVVLATGGPWSSVIAGWRIARRLHLPLVVDYRDPWTVDFPGRSSRDGFLASRLSPGLERRVLSDAAAVVSVMPYLPGMLEERLHLPGLQARCFWIPNGFDPDDFAHIDPRPSEFFTLTYAGSLYGGRTLAPIFQALTQLAQAGEIALERVRVQVLGPPLERVRQQAGDFPGTESVRAPGFVPHEETLQSLMASTVNLQVDIVYEGPNVHVPGKLYEYLRAGRPILAISPEGMTPALIREAEAGWVVAPGDSAALCRVLARAYHDWSEGRALPRPLPNVVERFNRARTTAHLEEILRRCAGEPAVLQGGIA